VGSLRMLPVAMYACRQNVRNVMRLYLLQRCKPRHASAFAVQLSSWHLNNISSLVGRSPAQDVELACIAAVSRPCMNCSCGAGTKAWIAPAPRVI